MADESLSVIDNRTGRHYELPIRDGAIAVTELQKMASDGAGTGLMSYDPAFLNQAGDRAPLASRSGATQMGLLSRPA
jgi:citrate synthase